MIERTLSELIGKRVLGVLGTYGAASVGMDVYICGVHVNSDIELTATFPKGHQLVMDEWVTLHLDNRTGVSEYDAELQVFRLSYKGKVSRISPHEVSIHAQEYQVFYGASVVKEYRAADYQYPLDQRRDTQLPVSPLQQAPQIDLNEQDNKIGVLLTHALRQPHSTVMAFLSSVDDDIFLITFPETFKAQLLRKDNRCYFAIDSRATFAFEVAIEWNYSIISGEMYQIPKTSPLFAQLKEQFICKNPWEVGFFSHPAVEMYHLRPLHVVCPQMA
ncbi:hypothetical protein [Shewanella fodinae]|jgi:hypothetical protein|uniref:hypothetical protein n=1 Tax=Shewanella fodinae TaxID=552357 RepID=UPI00167C188F|nr:hypothetical protein [Shewanella fodinae]MCL2906100.1 hypothetical protein [Shewanella fodinae]GGY98435.1 hypothetical protein GCM10007169_14170 [Shewanella fodinae]